MRQIKSLSTLRTFEAAARHMSFKSAAGELFVTPTAVSHQIRTLEKQLDCLLFERKTRQVLLTKEGHELYVSVQKAFDGIEETTRRISSRTTRDVVTLGLGPIIGSRWLAPRLGQFWAEHSDIDLRLHHSPLPIHQRIEQCDLAIAWGDGNWPTMQVEHLFDIQVTPVFSRCGLFEHATFTTPKEILHYPIIHQRDRKGWKQWLAEAGACEGDDITGTVIEDANIVLQIALDGQGLALGILPFINEDIVSGRLTQPFELAVNPGNAYYLIYRQKAFKRNAVKQVRNWITEQITQAEIKESAQALY